MSLEQKVKVTVVGNGYWGKNLVRNFYNLGALHSVCDVNRNAVNYLFHKRISRHKGHHNSVRRRPLLKFLFVGVNP